MGFVDVKYMYEQQTMNNGIVVLNKHFQYEFLFIHVYKQLKTAISNNHTWYYIRSTHDPICVWISYWHPMAIIARALFSSLCIDITNMDNAFIGYISTTLWPSYKCIVSQGMVVKFKKHFHFYHLACYGKHCCHIKNQCSNSINQLYCITIGTKLGIRNQRQ